MVTISGHFLVPLIFLGTAAVSTSAENVKLVLTPTHTELTDAAKQSFVALFDEAMVRYIGLQQSLSQHEGLEHHVESVDTAITSQLVESTFLLASADAGSTTRARARSRSRQLLEGVSTGSIVSSLNMELSSSASLVAAADDNVDVDAPNLKEYIIGFFTEDGAIASSFVDAARRIQDEYGRMPLSGLQVIGVGKNAMYDDPYSYLDNDAAEATNNAESDRETTRGSIIAGATAAANQDIGTQPIQANEDTSNTVHWMWVAIAAGGVAAIAVAALFVVVAVLRRKNKKLRGRKVDVQNQENTTAQQQKQTRAVPLSVLNCNDSLPSASPMSFDGPRGGAGKLNGSNYASSHSSSNETNDIPRYKIYDEQNRFNDRRPAPLMTHNDNEVTTLRSLWAEPFLSIARSAGFGSVLQPKESTDEDSKGNEIPKLALPPREFRKNSLAQQKETSSMNTSSRSRSAVEDLLGNKKGRVTPKDGRHTLHTNRADDLYVIPEDDASL